MALEQPDESDIVKLLLLQVQWFKAVDLNALALHAFRGLDGMLYRIVVFEWVRWCEGALVCHFRRIPYGAIF